MAAWSGPEEFVTQFQIIINREPSEEAVEQFVKLMQLNQLYFHTHRQEIRNLVYQRNLANKIRAFAEFLKENAKSESMLKGKLYLYKSLFKLMGGTATDKLGIQFTDERVPAAVAADMAALQVIYLQSEVRGFPPRGI